MTASTETEQCCDDWCTACEECHGEHEPVDDAYYCELCDEWH